MRVEEFDYNLPEELIAQVPIEPRDSSRLLVLNKHNGDISHDHFFNVGNYLKPGDVLVINDTKVLPARIYCTKDTGAVIELVLIQQVDMCHWKALVRPGKKVLPGTKLNFTTPDLKAEVVEVVEEGMRLIRFDFNKDFFTILDKVGQMPLPPYIKVPLQNQGRYQPVYARERGSAAAPTAGLHFTDELLASLQKQGIIIAKVLLHVGLGTFRPVKVDVVENHKMHAEYYHVDEENAKIIRNARAAGGRVISVGTTSTRTLETVADVEGNVYAAMGWTEKYIYPGYDFKIIDGLITNFHLPKSTLLPHNIIFAGKDNIMRAYKEAINERYRFFSFGDAMIIV
jgi:S-adenosylmethionine:tRNA ribosyltransferase-isomerase